MRFARKLLVAGFLLLVLLALLGASLGIALIKREARALPPGAEIVASRRPPATSTMLAGDGSVMERFAEQDREVVPFRSIPPLVVQAFVSAEDKTFWQHRGVDTTAVARAALFNLRNRGSGRRPIGASTISQQLAKNLVVGDEASLRRKVREALVAMRLETELGKERVIEAYLNEIYLGEGAWGVAAAARTYFGKSLDALTLPEVAFLAALPKGPSNYDPVRRPDAATARRAYVLRRMMEDGAATADDVRVANATPLPRPAGRANFGVASEQFGEAARREVSARLGSTAIYRDGLVIRTSLDARLQEVAERTLRDGLVAFDMRGGWRGPLAGLPPGTRLDQPAAWMPLLRQVQTPSVPQGWRTAAVLGIGRDAVLLGFPDGSTAGMGMDGMRWARRVGPRGPGAFPRTPAEVVRLGDVVLVDLADGRPALRQVPLLEGSLVALEASTGRVLAVAGGFMPERGAFNRATQAMRQPGSSFKPFIYLTAFENGWDPTSPVLDTPVGIDVGPGQQRWRPSGQSGGLITARRALEQSRNFSTVRLLHDLGLETVQATAIRMGVYDRLPNYAAALGALETTPLRMAGAYASLVNGGRRVVPSFVDRVDGPGGEAVYQRDPGGQVVATPLAAARTVSVLEGVARRGTAAAALGRFPHAVAGKTGTTNDNHDAWFVGFSTDIVVSVQLGYDRPASLGPEGTGGGLASPVFAAFMREALGIHPPSRDRFPNPPGTRLVRTDPNTGEPSPNGVEEIFPE